MAGDVVLVLGALHPEAELPVVVVALKDDAEVALVPGIDFIADGAPLAGVRFALPVAGPAQGQVAGDCGQVEGVLGA